MLSVLIGVLIICVVGAICFWVIEKFVNDGRLANLLKLLVVLVLLGVGLLFLRHAGPDMDVPMLVLGTVVLMPGIGFILSAGITWVLAGRLGLIPDNPSAANGPRDRQ